MTGPHRINQASRRAPLLTAVMVAIGASVQEPQLAFTAEARKSPTLMSDRLFLTRYWTDLSATTIDAD